MQMRWKWTFLRQPCRGPVWLRLLLFKVVMAGSNTQWNARGLKADVEQLCLLTKKYKPTVITLQETLLANDKHKSLSGFHILTKEPCLRENPHTKQAKQQ